MRGGGGEKELSGCGVTCLDGVEYGDSTVATCDIEESVVGTDCHIPPGTVHVRHYAPLLHTRVIALHTEHNTTILQLIKLIADKLIY